MYSLKKKNRNATIFTHLTAIITDSITVTVFILVVLKLSQNLDRIRADGTKNLLKTYREYPLLTTISCLE